MAVAASHPHARAARENAAADRRGARSACARRHDAAGRHLAVLHEPAGRGRSAAAAAADRRADAQRVCAHRRRSGRSAGRRFAQPGAGTRASLPGPRAAPAARLLLDVLPLLHAVARGRPRRADAAGEPADGGVRLPAPHAADSRRADLRRRCARARRRQARVDPPQPAGDPEHRVHPHRHEDAGRVAAADHARAGAACCGGIIRFG